MATTGGVGILVAGPIFFSTGAVVGGFVGAMTTRGVEKELAHYYDQAVTQGKILVAVENHSDRAEERLAQAARIFATAGTEPLRLPEG